MHLYTESGMGQVLSGEQVTLGVALSAREHC